MFTRTVGIATIVPALLIAAATVHASPNGSDQECVFDKYPATAVQPYRAEENLYYSTYNRLRGAQLYVPAREGLTKEWLALNIQRGLAKQAADAARSCRPDVREVKVDVISAGGGFWVVLSTPDEHAAETLLRWAQTVVPQSHAGRPLASR